MLALCLTATGCNNLSPRLDPEQKQQNQGDVQQMEQMANSLKAEILKLQQQNDIQNSQLEKIQQGLANFQSSNENTGVQILSGPGGLMLSMLFIVALSVLLLYYRRLASLNEKAADILAERIVVQQDRNLEDDVFKAAVHTEVQEAVLRLIQKQKAKLS